MYYVLVRAGRNTVIYNIKLVDDTVTVYYRFHEPKSIFFPKSYNF